MKRLKYILSKIFYLLTLLIAVSLISFILVTKSPIDPLTSYIGVDSTLSKEAKDEISEHWGLNDSLDKRFFKWTNNVIHGDLGTSITYKKPVSTVILERFKYSFILMIVAWSISGILGFIIGIIAGVYKGSIFDKIVKIFCLGLQSAPTFWLGLIILYFFAVYLGWFPIGLAAPIGKLSSDVTLFDRISHLILPALTLSIVSISKVVLYTRQKVIENMNSEYILFAKARGESTRQIILRHIVRNTALPAITTQFASFSELFGGMALAETVFSYPGIGTATTEAGINGDVPLLLGIAIFSALFVFCGNLIANVLYGILDPRLKEGGGYNV